MEIVNENTTDSSIQKSAAPYSIRYYHDIKKDLRNLKNAHLDGKAKELIDLVKENPEKQPPSYEKLEGDLAGLYSRRINRQHRLVYGVDPVKKIIYVYSMWTHYATFHEDR